MYGQMTAGSWIYIGTQGILQGTYETFAECARQHFGGTLAGRLVVTGGLGGMGGAQPLAATMNGAAFLGVDVDPARIQRRVDTGYCDRMSTDLDEALRAGRAAQARAAGAVGRTGRATSPRCCPSWSAAASCPTCSPTRPRRTISGSAISPPGYRSKPPRTCASATRQATRRGCSTRWCVHVKAMLDAAGARAPSPSTTATTCAARWPTGAACGEAFDIPGFVPEFIRPLFCRGAGPFRWAALSGDPADIAVTDQAVLETFPDNEPLARWIRQAREKVHFQGLPARICWLEYGERAEMGLRFNWLVKKGKVKAPLVIGRDHLDTGSVASPNRETEAMKDGSRRHRRLAAAQRDAQHRLRRQLGLAAPRWRRRHRLLDSCRDGRRRRWHRDRATAGCSACSPPIPAPASCATPMRATSSRSRPPASAAWTFR